MMAYMYKNSCLSLLLATRVVSPGGISVPWAETEIPYWWFKICPESCQELWLVGLAVILFKLLITNSNQKANGQMQTCWTYYKNLFLCGTFHILFFRKKKMSFAGAPFRRTQIYPYLTRRNKKSNKFTFGTPLMTTELIM